MSAPIQTEQKSPSPTICATKRHERDCAKHLVASKDVKVLLEILQRSQVSVTEWSSYFISRACNECLEVLVDDDDDGDCSHSVSCLHFLPGAELSLRRHLWWRRSHSASCALSTHGAPLRWMVKRTFSQLWVAHAWPSVSVCFLFGFTKISCSRAAEIEPWIRRTEGNWTDRDVGWFSLTYRISGGQRKLGPGL